MPEYESPEEGLDSAAATLERASDAIKAIRDAASDPARQKYNEALKHIEVALTEISGALLELI
jgi:hypothetical protein